MKVNWITECLISDIEIKNCDSNENANKGDKYNNCPRSLSGSAF